MTLSSPRHIAALLDEFGMWDAKPNANPMAKGTAVGKGEPLGDNNRYAEFFGSLTYLAIGRSQTLLSLWGGCHTEWRARPQATWRLPRLY